MATLQFFAGQGSENEITGGSGLGFYGATGFGSSVAVGNYADTCFITNSTGTAQGTQANNFKYIASDNPGVGSGIINGSPQLALTYLPNEQATLHIRFTHATGVQTQNAEIRIYDRVNVDSAPTGVTCKAAEIVHPDGVQNNTGSGDVDWSTISGYISLPMIDSPGMSGLRPDGALTVSDDHSWYAALSFSPDSIGSKSQFALLFSTEYL